MYTLLHQNKNSAVDNNDAAFLMIFYLVYLNKFLFYVYRNKKLFLLL